MFISGVHFVSFKFQPTSHTDRNSGSGVVLELILFIAGCSKDPTDSPNSQFADAGIHDCTDAESEDQRICYSPVSSVSEMDIVTVGKQQSSWLSKRCTRRHLLEDLETNILKLASLFVGKRFVLLLMNIAPLFIVNCQGTFGMLQKRQWLQMRLIAFVEGLIHPVLAKECFVN